MNSSLRGRGSNQYADKPKDIVVPADIINKARAAARLRSGTVASSSSLADGRITELPDGIVLGRFSHELDDYFKNFDGAQSDEAFSRETLKGVRNISKYEDAIATNHPDSYGSAMIDAVWWSKEVQNQPALRKEIRIPGSKPARRHAAFLNILRDTDTSNPEGKLSVEQLADNLDELYLTTTEGTDAWGGGISDSAKLHNRYAAASALAQREKSPERRKILLDQANQIQATLNEGGIQRMNL